MKKSESVLYQGRILRLLREEHLLPGGRAGNFEVVRHSGGAAIIPVLPDSTILLLRQYRPTAGGMVVEIPAGRLDPGEAPLDCARRELEEETGWRAGRIIPLGSILASVGYTDERIHLFAGLELTPGQENREPDEFIEPFAVPFSEAIAMAADGRIDDAKSAIALLRFAAQGKLI